MSEPATTIARHVDDRSSRPLTGKLAGSHCPSVRCNHEQFIVTSHNAEPIDQAIGYDVTTLLANIYATISRTYRR